jgi:hypothetical protein
MLLACSSSAAADLIAARVVLLQSWQQVLLYCCRVALEEHQQKELHPGPDVGVLVGAEQAGPATM